MQFLFVIFIFAKLATAENPSGQVVIETMDLLRKINFEGAVPCSVMDSQPPISGDLCKMPHLGKFPKFEPPPASVLGIQPYSKRAVAFAKHYQKISEELHPYLGEPKVITSLAFESHVVKDVSHYLEKLENAIEMGKKLRSISIRNPGAAVQFLRELLRVLDSKDMFFATARYGLEPLLRTPPTQWGKAIDRMIAELESLHENMAAMNMHIFSYMTSASASPLELYFRKVAECDPKFDGWMDFPDDKNGILREAFHKFFLLSKSTKEDERKKLSYEFSILLIAHEQMYAQRYYDNIKSQHQKLAGAFKVKDPVGEYKLVGQSWADFNVRFSLNGQKNIEELTPQDILSGEAKPGTIPGYYRDRIYSARSLSLLSSPSFPPETKPSPPADAGQHDRAMRLFEKHGCVGCHKIKNEGDAPAVGPDLSRLGSILTRAEIKQAILNPNAEISSRCGGNRCPTDIMPQNYRETLTEEELETIVNYLSSQH